MHTGYDKCRNACASGVGDDSIPVVIERRRVQMAVCINNPHSAILRVHERVEQEADVFRPAKNRPPQSRFLLLLNHWIRRVLRGKLGVMEKAPSKNREQNALDGYD